MLPPGAEPLPDDAAFRFDPPVAKMDYAPPQPVKGCCWAYSARPVAKPAGT